MNVLRLGSIATLVTAVACGGDFVAPQAQSHDPLAPPVDQDDLAAARGRWRTQNLHTYAFTLQRSCFCGNVHPLYVVVLSDTVAGVLDLTTAESVDRRLGLTVDGLFTFIQSAIDGHAQLIRVEYDTVKGFPATIDYDGASQIADDEISYHASDVHPIAPQP